MFFSKRKYGLKHKFFQNYEDEIKRQTDAYSYSLNEYETDIRGVLKSSPLFSIAEYYKGNSKYYVYIGGNGRINKNAIESLFEDINPEESDLIYCDEDYIDKNNICNYPYLKPEWSEHTLLNTNYIGNFFGVKESLIADLVTGFDNFNISNENVFRADVYELLLEISTLTNKITHVPKTLFHIYYNGVFADNMAVSTEIYNEFYREQITAEMNQIREKAFEKRGYFVDNEESVSIIIPSKDNSDSLIKCLKSIKIKTKFNNNNLEIVIVDNGSNEKHKKAVEEYIGVNNDIKIKYIYEPMEFNFSYMCNLGVREAKGRYYLFMNDDIEVVSEDYINRMLFYGRRPEVGAVGIKLLYPDSDLIQHTGVCDLDCGPSHKLSHHKDSIVHYFGINKFTRDVYAVTGACLLVESEKYFKVGGFHDKMKVGYNDIDLCLKLYENKYFNVVINDSFLYHHESLSRGEDSMDDMKYKRLEDERKLFYSLHPGALTSCDPFYHKDLIQDSLDYKVDIKSRCDDRFYRVMPEELNNLKNSKLAHFNIEEIAFERGIAAKKTSSDCYRITGWGLLDKTDNRLFKRYFVLSSDDRMLYFPVNDKYREDVSKVFEKSKETLLCGFVIRIDQKYIEKNKVYRMGMAYISYDEKKKYCTMGGLYATDRGIFTEEA